MVGKPKIFEIFYTDDVPEQKEISEQNEADDKNIKFNRPLSPFLVFLHIKKL